MAEQVGVMASVAHYLLSEWAVLVLFIIPQSRSMMYGVD